MTMRSNTIAVVMTLAALSSPRGFAQNAPFGEPANTASEP